MNEPGRAVRSIGELLTVLLTMEEQAANRYADLAGSMERRGATDSAALFRRLAEEEQTHVREVAHWRKNHLPDVGIVPADQPLPQAAAEPEEIAEFANSAMLTPYRALAFAVREEERAVVFWSYVSAQAPDKAVREAAEKVAHQELEHVALLRRERRRAFHLERTERLPPASLSPAALLHQADRLEHDLLAVFAQLAAEPGEDRTAARDLVRMTREMIVGLEELRDRSPPELPRDGFREALLTLSTDAPPMVKAELAVEIYLGVAERATSEEVLAAAHALGERAIVRLAQLRGGKPV